MSVLDEVRESFSPEAIQVRVVDVMHTSSADEAERALNEPYERGYYVHRAIECVDRTRVVFVHHTKPASWKPEKPIKEPAPKPTKAHPRYR